jgi:hypothetical protein
MKKVILMTAISFAMISCGGEAATLKDNMDKDVETMCEIQEKMSSGKFPIGELAEQQQAIWDKYEGHDDLKTELSNKIKECK